MLSNRSRVSWSAIVFLTTTGAAFAHECSTASLGGLYSVSFHGETLGVLKGDPPALVPFASPNLVKGVEVVAFDGRGNLQQLAFAMRNGIAAAAGQSGLTPDGFNPGAGTYHVNADCTGSGQIKQPGQMFTIALVVGNNGRSYRYVNTSLRMSAIPGNPDCASGCYVGIEISAEGERITGDAEK